MPTRNSSAKRTRSSARTPVLHVGLGAVEWLFEAPDGSLELLSASVRDPRPSELAALAAEIADGRGGLPKSCVVSLSSDITPDVILRLPRLEQSELREVLTRRAVQSLGCEAADALYVAVPLAEDEGGSEDSDEPTDSWLLYLQRRSFVFALSFALRERGVEVVRCVASRSALAASAPKIAGDDSKAFLYVGVEPGRTVYGLGRGDQLYLQNVLETDLGPSNPAGVLGLVQELRNLGAWWRKRSRGEGLGSVVWIGVDAELSGSMEPALRASFGAVEFHHLVPTAVGSEFPRAEILAASRSTRPGIADFRVQLPTRTPRLVAAGLGLTAVCALGATLVHGAWSERLERSRAELTDMRVLGERSDALRAARSRLSELESRVVLRTDELERLASRGIPLAALLQHTERVFAGETHLTSMTVGPSEGGFDVQIGASARAAADRTGALLAAAERELAAATLFSEPPRVLPPSALPDAGAESELVFTVQAHIPDGSSPARIDEEDAW